MTSSFMTARHDHVTIRVANFEATVKWYCEKLGFVIDRQWTPAPYVGANLRAAYIRLNDAILEIVGGGDPRTSRDSPNTVPELFAVDGYNHMCLSVEDIHAAKAELEAKGIIVYAGPNTSTTLNRRFLHFRDLNGLSIEVVQYLS